MLSIPEKDFLGHRPARTLLVVDEREPLAAMLRDSEPPAHTSWRPQDERVAKRWVGPHGRIKQVREAPLALLSIWETTPVGLRKDALADIFPVRRRTQARAEAGPGSRRRSRLRSSQTCRLRTPDFDLHQVSGGFGVRFAHGIEAPPHRVRLRAAYEVPRGNAMTSYNPHDFRLHGPGALEVDAKGCLAVDGERGKRIAFRGRRPRAFLRYCPRGSIRTRDLLVDVQRAAAERSRRRGVGR